MVHLCPNEDGGTNDEPGSTEFDIPDSDFLTLDGLHWELGTELFHLLSLVWDIQEGQWIFLVDICGV